MTLRQLQNSRQVDNSRLRTTVSAMVAIGELSMRSDRFRELWASHNVRRHHAGRKSFRHPVVGLLEVNYVSLELTGDPGLVLTTYTATPGSPAEEALRLLASWAATERVAEQAGSRTESTVG